MNAAAPSRPLFAVAALVFGVVALSPLAAMLVEVRWADLSDLASPRTLSLLGRTILLGGGVALGAAVMGVPFGFLVARTNVPLAGTLRVAGALPLLLPPLMIAMSWAVLVPGLRGAPATIAMLALSTFPLVALFTVRAFERIDARTEEAALLVGGWRAVLAVDLPLVLPAVATGAALAFLFAINDFGVPDYVSSVGPKFNVYADEIKLNWDQYQRPGKPVAAALPLMLLALVALLPSLALRRRGALASLAGDFRAPGRLDLGRWRWAGFAFCLGIVALGALIPLGRLVWEGAGLPAAFRTGDASLAGAFATLRRETGVALDLARSDLANSLTFAAGAALVAVPLGAILGHAIERVGRFGRGLEAVVLLPIAAPAILFGIGTITVWNRPWSADFYDSNWMPLILFVGRYVAFATLLASVAVAPRDRELEEAATLAGAGPIRRLFGIVAPTLKGTWVAAAVLVFVFTMRDLDAAILVPAANRTAMMRVFNGVHFGRDSYVACLSLLVVFATVLPGLLWTLFAKRRLEVLP
ncbi:MAG: ABC transporter permease subunit [Planctomycetota bacterium]